MAASIEFEAARIGGNPGGEDALAAPAGASTGFFFRSSDEKGRSSGGSGGGRGGGGDCGEGLVAALVAEGFPAAPSTLAGGRWTFMTACAPGAAVAAGTVKVHVAPPGARKLS